MQSKTFNQFCEFFVAFFSKNKKNILAVLACAVFLFLVWGIWFELSHYREEVFVFKNTRTASTSQVVAGLPVRMITLVDANEIKNGKRLVKVPKSATNVTVKKITPEEIKSLKNNGQFVITEEQRLNIIKSIKNKPAKNAVAKNVSSRNFLGSLADGMSLFLADEQQAVENVVSAIVPDSNSQLVDVSNPAPAEPAQNSADNVAGEPTASTPAITETPPPTETTSPTDTTPPTDQTNLPPVDNTPPPDVTPDQSQTQPAENPSNIQPDQQPCQGDATDNCIAVEYVAPAPVIEKTETDNGQLVTVSAQDETTPLTDVVAFTTIPEIYKVGDEKKIKIKWKSNDGQEVKFTAKDLDGNGLIDYLEWTVPHLSEQTFEIIFISKAFQLDASQNIISDIYDKVRAQDGNWAQLTDGQYIRATFDQALQNFNDNTIYARPRDPSSPVKIEVYPVYTDENGNMTDGPLVATFENIDHEDTYKIPLTNLQNSTDTFDLKIFGNVDVDFVVDPNNYWTNTDNNNSYNDANNWSLGHVPTSSDTAVFDTTSTADCNINVDVSVAALQLNSGYSGTVTQTSTYIVTSAGAVAISAGKLTLINSNTLSGGVTLNAGGTLNINSALALGAGTLTINGGTIDNTSAGSVTINNAETWNASFAFTGTQALNLGTGAVTLGANTTVTISNSQTLTIGGTINGAYTLTISDTGGIVTFGGNIGGSTPIRTLAVTATTINLNTTAITLASTYGITFTGAVVLGANVAITTSGTNTVNFTSTINGAYNLTVGAGTGTVTFGGIIGGSTPIRNFYITASTAINLNTTAITFASGYSPSFTGPVVLGANISITTSGTNTVGFSGSSSTTINGAYTLTINAGASGSVNFSGVIGGTTPIRTLSVTATSGINLSASAITIAANYGATFTGPVALGTDVTINCSGTAHTINFTSTINSSANLTINGGASTTVTFGGIIGGSTPLHNLSVTAGTAINLNTTAITLYSGYSATFTGPVVLGANLAISTAGVNTVNFAGTINGAYNLTAGSSTLTLGGAIGGTTPLHTLSFSGSTAINLNTSAITLASGYNLSFNAAVTLGSPTTTITTSGTNSVTFMSPVNGANNLTINAGASGTVYFYGTIGNLTPIRTLSVTAGTAISLSTSAITLASGYGATFTGPVTLNSATVTITPAGTSTINFTSSVSGANNLTIAGVAGTTVTFGGSIGSPTPIHTLAVTAGTAINLNGAGITLAANYGATFTGPVVLGATVSIGCSGTSHTINFTSTINGAQGLYINGGTNTTATFGGIIGGSTPIQTLSVTAGTAININTTGITLASGYSPTFLGPVVLGVNTSITTSGSNTVNFSGSTATINGAYTLTINSGSFGTVTFGGIIGGSTPIRTLSVTASTAINLSKNVTIAANYGATFTGPVVLGANVQINCSGTAHTINFTSSISGAYTFTISGVAGTTVAFGGIIGSPTPIQTLSVTAGTAINLNTSLITIAANYGATFTGPVVLGSPVTVNCSGTAHTINFAQTINGAQTLTVSGGANTTVTFGGVVGGTTPLSTINITAATINSNANMAFTGGTWSGAVALGTTCVWTINTGTLAIGGIISGSTFGIQKNGDGTLTLSGANNFSGGFQMNTGILNINNASALGSALAWINGGTINNTSGNPITVTNDINWGGNFAFTGTKDINFSGAWWQSDYHYITVNGGNLTISGTINDDTNYIGIGKYGTGALTLSGDNNTDDNPAIAFGGVSVYAGTLNIANAGALGGPYGILYLYGGTIDNTSGSPLTVTGTSCSFYGNFAFAGTNDLSFDTVSSSMLYASSQITTNTAGKTLTFEGGISGSNSYVMTKAGAGALTLSGTNIFSGGTTLNAGTLTVNNSSGLGTGQFLQSGGTFVGTGDINIGGNFSLSGGTFNSTSGNLSVAGNWSHTTGTFNHNNGTVTFNGTNQSIAGSTNFKNFSKIDTTNNSTDVILTFDHTGTQTIAGLLTLQGIDNNDRVNLVSDSPGTRWGLVANGTFAINYADVTDSDASGGTTVVQTNSIDGGHNLNWLFNVAPYISGSVSTYDATTLSSTDITLIGNSTKNVVCSATAYDGNGYSDLTGVTAVLYRSGVGAGAGDDRSNHYTLTSQCVASGGSGNTQVYTCTFSVYYYADATDAGTYSGENWLCKITPADHVGAGTSTVSSGIEMDTLKYIDVSSLNYGSLTPGQNTTSDHKATVTNEGNVATGFKVSGVESALTCSSRGTIAIGYEQYHLTSFVYGGGAALAQVETDTGASINKPTQSTPLPTQDTYWQMYVPNGVKGTCTGSTTFGVN